MSRILIVEDDMAILEGLKDNLEFDGYDVVTATDGAEGFRKLMDQNPDLVILDLMLPMLSGYEVCRRARENGCTAPILMLTARGEEMDRVLGLDLGADDYVTKPFSTAELLARVRAILRRTERERPSRLRFGDVDIDFESYEARKAGRAVSLSPKEFGVLRHLAAHPNKVVTREELLDEVWEYDQFPTTRTVDNHIASLRSKLEDDVSAPRHVLTVYGVGYKFVERP